MSIQYTAQSKIVTIALLAGLIFFTIGTLKSGTDPQQLPLPDLLGQGFEILAREGLQDVAAILTASNYQTRIVTYRQWTKFHGSVPTDATLASVGWSWDMPVLVMAAQGATVMNQGGLVPAGGQPKRDFAGLIIALNARDGTLMSVQAYPDYVPFPRSGNNQIIAAEAHNRAPFCYWSKFAEKLKC